MIDDIPVSDRTPTHVTWRSTGGRFSADGRALLAFAVLTTIVAWNRLVFDDWLTRLDIFTQYLPWFTFLGERLRALDIPGWNPHLFSGAPFAGNPQSNWMYLPTMVTFALLPPLVAFKAMVVAQLAVAGLATYAYGRILGFGPLAALVAAVAYVVGPLLHWTTYCCLIMGEFAVWVPLLLLGLELAFRTSRWPDRVASCCFAGFALSQMFAGWVGQGWIYAVLIATAYIGYRTFLWPPPWPGSDLRGRLAVAAVTGLVTAGFGLGLGAAGILPRLAVNPQTLLTGGDYTRVGAASIMNRPWEVNYLIDQIAGLGTGYPYRATALGGAVVVLALLAPLLAGRRFAVPFFAALTLVAMTLTLDTTPLHRLFFLIPRYQALHQHDPWRVLALGSMGPAMLSGAAVEVLPSWRGQWQRLPLVVAPLLVVALVTAVLRPVEWVGGVVGWAPLVATAVTTLALAVAVALPLHESRPRMGGTVPYWVPVVVLAAVFAQPMGLELTGSWLGWPHDPRWESHWRPDPESAQALAAEVARSDPDGAGEFLQARLNESEPFRYVGYSQNHQPDQGWIAGTYMDRRFEPTVQAILVNGRPIFLGLYEIQGYDPIQLARYAEFMAALNDTPQDYHTAFLLPSGGHSPLLDLLDVRYALVDATLPRDRDDVVALTAGRHEVFRTERVVVYERIPTPRHAWIVHDVQAVDRGAALPLLAGGVVDPYRTALIEGTPPTVAVLTGSTEESARVTRYAPDALTIATRASAAGLLVVSEVYESGWRAFVDGEPVEVLPTDHLLRGVPIPAGEHMVQLRYEPRALRLGVLISGITVVVMLGAFAVAGWTQFRHERGVMADPCRSGSTATSPRS
jgi:hypothetical protein